MRPSIKKSMHKMRLENSSVHWLTLMRTYAHIRLDYIRLDSAVGCVSAILPVPMCHRRRHHHSDGVPHITLEHTIFVNFVCAVREKHRVRIVVLSFAMKVNWRNQPMELATRARTRTQPTQRQLWNYCARHRWDESEEKKTRFWKFAEFRRRDYE